MFSQPQPRPVSIFVGGIEARPASFRPREMRQLSEEVAGAVIAYGLVSFSGLFIGILLGWVMWG